MTARVSSRAETRKQAELLLNPDHYPVLNALTQGPHTATTLAELLGLPLSRAHYLLQTLTRAGIARVTSVTPRAGRAVRHYAVTHDWFVPFEVTPAHTLEELIAHQVESRMRRFVRLMLRHTERHGSHWGFWLRAGSSGALSVTLADPDGEFPTDEEPMMAGWARLRLTSQNAFTLRERLGEVFGEFASRENDEGSTYTVGLFLARGELQ